MSYLQRTSGRAGARAAACARRLHSGPIPDSTRRGAAAAPSQAMTQPRLPSGAPWSHGAARGAVVARALAGAPPAAPKAAPATPKAAAAPAAKVAAGHQQVQFKINYATTFGEVVKLVGEDVKLGAWNPADGMALTWGVGNVWSGTVAVPTGAELSFKVVVHNTHTSDCRWEDGANRVYTVDAALGDVVQMRWGEAAASGPPAGAPALGGPMPWHAAAPGSERALAGEAIAAAFAAMVAGARPGRPWCAAPVPEPRAPESEFAERVAALQEASEFETASKNLLEPFLPSEGSVVIEETVEQTRWSPFSSILNPMR